MPFSICFVWAWAPLTSTKNGDWKGDSNLQPVFHELYATHLVIDLKHCSHLLEDESEYLRGNVWVASGETGHNPDVSGSYQAQGPSFLQYIPVEERSRRVNEDLLQRSGSVWQRDRKREKENERCNTHTASSLEQYSSITGLWILLRAMCDLEFGSPSIASRVTTLCMSQRTKL